ncbi:hypothetical protein [Tolypothrix sp. VBCCA 56010]|uniref:hypothetical protein n=1 Tax=Tolypothrix sp. VBCCA 56010 TaxID=3137731 RepID=UPI003D7DC977
MFNRLVERELLDGEPWLVGQQSQLPLHLQLLVEQEQGRQNIWELPDKESRQNAQNQKFQGGFLRKIFDFFNIYVK